jgi:cytochrome c
MNRILSLTLCVAAVVFTPAARAEEYATTRDAELLVRRAAEVLQHEGRAAALAKFNDRKGPFVYRDLYVFAYDLDGNCLAHPIKPERIGKNNLGDKDPDGRLFVKERIELARKQRSGWQEYKFFNPASGKVEQKVAYFELVDGVVLVAGAYKPR